MSRQSNLRLLADFRRRQAAVYRGGEPRRLAELLTKDATWHVPGRSPIAGDHHGRAAVLEYFERRRRLAEDTLEIEVIDSIAVEEGVVEVADGRAVLGGEPASWRTAGLYRTESKRIAEAWLVPFELERFDQAWSRTRRRAHVHHTRVRAQECAEGGLLGHPRLLEHLEAAFIEAWRERVGPLPSSLGPTRRLTVKSVEVEYEAPVRFDDPLRVEVSFDQIGMRSLRTHYLVSVAYERAAEARVSYLCVQRSTGVPTALPEQARKSLLENGDRPEGRSAGRNVESPS